MTTAAERPTRFWMQGPTGIWWRNGVAKGHLTLACFGLALPLVLERRGDITLTPETRRTLLAVLLPAVRRLATHDFRIRDRDGRPTQFGNLSPQGLNGFNMVLTLSLLRSAAPYDAGLHHLYEEKVVTWAGPIAWSLTRLAGLVRSLGHARLGKPSYSDMQLIALAATALLMQEHRPRPARAIRRGLTGLWSFMAAERNAPFTLCYTALVAPAEGAVRLPEIVADLRDFPIHKRPVHGRVVHTGEVQPLANRPIDSNYWKASPFARLAAPGTPAASRLGGQDYLLVYWLGRYFNLLPRE